MFFKLLDIISPYYFYALIMAASYFLILSIANHYEMWRFNHGPEIFDGPMVSVLVPMRNEENNVRNCIASLQNQLYKNYEILVINDNSSDGTADILAELASKDNRIKVFNGKPLPDDWYGKPFALHQLSLHAKGEILVFTDADTFHNPASISWAVTNIKLLNVDMISGYIGQVFKTFGEIVTIPLMFFITSFIMPLHFNRFFKSSVFSAAVGQFIAIRHDVFKAIGGCELYKKKTTEDIYMSRYVKKKGYKTRFLNLCEHVQCRMYYGHRNAIEGIGKNVFDFFGKKTIVILFLFIAVFIFLFLPFPLLFFCIAANSKWILHIFIVNCLYSLTWIFTFLGQRLNWWYFILWPLMYLNLMYMAGWSWFRTITGKGFLWKGRKVS